LTASSPSAEQRGRGGGWVVAQFALIVAILVAGFFPPHWPGGAEPVLRPLSALLAFAGAGLAVAASRALGRALTPFPEPRGELVERGPYRFVRHPVYAGGLLFFLGFSLFASVPALALTGVLTVVWWLKSSAEERRLERHYPGYAGYRRRVPHRFVPGLL
jgi:protein-S-isoprenylcysteine O-methyltransferase Ste14